MIYMISGMEKGAVTFPVAQFADAVRAHWGAFVASVLKSSDGMLVASIQPSDAPGFAIRLDEEGRSIATDGTEEQTADVAMWVLTLLPEAHKRVVLYDANGFRELENGMTTTDVWTSWQSF